MQRSEEDSSLPISNQSIRGGKLTDQLIEQGLLTKGMMDQLKREWDDKLTQKGVKKKSDNSDDA